jgi:cytidine deaminase
LKRPFLTADLDVLRAHAAAAALRSHAPFSGEPGGAALRLTDGRWVAAPRLEITSFPLTIPALFGAWALGAVAGQAPVAAASTRPLTASDLAFLGEATGRPWRLVGTDFAVADGAEMPDDPSAGSGQAAGPVDLIVPAPADDAAGTAAALDAARSAVVPASDFPVGAVAVDAAGRAVRGANVEVASDWTRGLCAERVAVVAAHAAGLGPLVRVWVACTRAPGGSPCGACRQVLSDMAPDAAVVLWQGDAPALVTSSAALLPGAFRGDGLGRAVG